MIKYGILENGIKVGCFTEERHRDEAFERYILNGGRYGIKILIDEK